MIVKKFLTTGEASRLLNISRSTISRNFDKGILFGQKNPITGERLISRESLIEFMKQFNLSLDPALMGLKKILVGTADEKILSFFQKVFSHDRRIQIEGVTFGGDVLVRRSKEHPDLLIVDEDLPDIPGKEVLRSLRRADPQHELKIICCSKTGRAKQCVEWGADEAVAKDALEEGALLKKVYQLLNIPAERPQEEQHYKHERRWPRVGVNLPGKIGVYSLRSPQNRDSGKGVVENISCGGAYLSELQLDNERLPGEPFRFFLEINQSPLENWRAHCKVVRLHSDGTLAAGVQFIKLTKVNRSMVEEVSLHGSHSDSRKSIPSEEEIPKQASLSV